jgi:NodT family efflux transporter outer membrane factor (OMF) lipoprotein
MRRLRAWLLMLAAASLAAGCANPGPETERRALRDPASLAAARALEGVQFSAAHWPNAQWWTAFGDPQLDALIERALAGNPSIAVAAARLEKARAGVLLASSALRPEAIGALDMTYQRFSETGVFVGPRGGEWLWQNRLALDMTFNLDLWGRNRAALESAVGQERAAEIDTFAARLALATGVARAYVELGRLHAQADVAREVVRHREQIHGLTAKRFEAGIDSRVDLALAEAGVPAARADLAAAEEAIALMRNLVASLVGQGPDAAASLDRPKLVVSPSPLLPSVLPADLLGRRPDLIGQRWRVEAAARDIDVARAQFYPNINLIAFIGFSSIGLGEFIGAASRIAGLGPAVRVPLFDGGQLRAELAGRRADYDIAVEQYNQTLLDALREVVDHVTSLRALEVRRADQAIALERYRKAYDLALLRYREGMGSYLDVLNAEVQLLAQNRIDADLAARRLDLAVGLVRALGGGFSDRPPG